MVGKSTKRSKQKQSDVPCSTKKPRLTNPEPDTVKSDTSQRSTCQKRRRAQSPLTSDNVSAESPGNLQKCSMNKFVGAHTSTQGGLQNAVFDAAAIGAKAFGLFLRSQRQWVCKPLLDETVAKFKQACQDNNYPTSLILPHGSYLINAGAPNPETLAKSRDALVDEMKRCEKLGLTLYNFHPGSSCGLISTEECLQTVADSINYAHKQTKSVITVIENMSCQGNTVGGKFEELKKIIDLVEDKSRVGVCLDTCHAFAAGYDLSKESGFKKMMTDFEKIIGLQYLKGVHLNDSKGKCGCHLDRHENIGKGHIGKEGFRRVMKDPRFNDIPMILETPLNVEDAAEIELLYTLC